jgi:hypothetical protein
MTAARSAAGARRARPQGQQEQQPQHTTGPGLNPIRHDLEHRPPAPRDPFTAGAARTVDGLRLRWNDLYAITATGNGYEAVRRHGPHVTLTAATPDGLTRAMLEDSGSW